MKKSLLTVVVLLFCFYSQAQTNDGTERKPVKNVHKKGDKGKPPALYITTSTGLNNNTGIIGLNLELPVSPNISIEAGAGIGSWGNKVYAGAKYYLRPHHLGWALGVGITHNSGLSDFTDNLSTIYGSTESVTLDLYPVTNMYFAAYRYWKLGQGANRFFLELGYSVAFTNDKFDQTSGDPIDQNAINTMNLISPGGLIAAVGFSFAIR